MARRQPNTIYPKLRDFMEEAFKIYLNNVDPYASVKDFALLVGVSPTNMGRYLKGEQKPEAKHRALLAKVVGPGIDAACENEPTLPDDPQIRQVFYDIYELTPKERDAQAAMIHELAERRRAARHSKMQTTASIT